MAPQARPIITLITDFGLADPFVGVMKGVMLGIAPEVHILDITHCVPSHNVLQASLVLRASYRFFPKGTIHVVVVDPGVGSSRYPILVVTQSYYFIGPDNGVLSLACELEDQAQIFHLTSQKYFLNPVSQTFHGRDIFAPVAAWLSRGTAPDLLGGRIPSLVKLDFPRVRRKGSTLVATVLHTDKFGNLVTNISSQDLPTLEKQSLDFVIQLGDKTISRLRRSYAEASPGEIFSIWGSSGLLEISMNQASAAETLSVEEGQEFVIVLQPAS